MREMAIQEHGVAAGHEQGGDQAGVTLDRYAGVKVLEVFGLDEAFPGLDAATEVVQGKGLAVDFYAPAKYETVDFVDFVADER